MSHGVESNFVLIVRELQATYAYTAIGRPTRPPAVAGDHRRCALEIPGVPNFRRCPDAVTIEFG